MNPGSNEAKITETLKCNSSHVQQLKQMMQDTGWEFFEHQDAFFRSKQGNITVVAYKSGNVVISGPESEARHVLDTIVRIGGSDDKSADGWIDHIGVDESGKGDFFGPLVIAGVFVKKEAVDQLKKLGVRDSKKIKDKKILKISESLRKIIENDVVAISPSKYNELYKNMRNINKILAWGHARVIENLLDRKINCGLAVSDQFASFKGRLERALMERGKKIELNQMHGGESDLAVAAASIIARAVFLQGLQQMRDEFDLDFPKGAFNGVTETGKIFLERFGKERLKEVAKLNFSTVKGIY